MLYLKDLAPSLWHGRVKVIADDARYARLYTGEMLDECLDGFMYTMRDSHGLALEDGDPLGLWRVVSVMPCLDTGSRGAHMDARAHVEVHVEPTAESAAVCERAKLSAPAV